MFISRRLPTHLVQEADGYIPPDMHLGQMLSLSFSFQLSFVLKNDIETILKVGWS